MKPTQTRFTRTIAKTEVSNEHNIQRVRLIKIQVHYQAAHTTGRWQIVQSSHQVSDPGMKFLSHQECRQLHS